MIVRIVLGVALACSVIVPTGASAGGFSTVGLESLPLDVRAGEVWVARFTVLSHGRMPMAGLKPVVRIEAKDGGGRRAFGATETAAAGVYEARVVFPADGRWTIEVAEHAAIAGTPVAGHSFGTVDVGGAQAAPASEAQSTGRPGSLPALAISLALGLLSGGGAWLVEARRAAARSAAGAG